MTTKKEAINQMDNAIENKMLINFDLMRKKIKAAHSQRRPDQD